MVFESQRPSSAPVMSRSSLLELLPECSHDGQLKLTTAVCAFGAAMKELTYLLR
jgi:hypothetical protein